MSPHLQRWITAIVVVPILIGVIGFGSLALFSLLIFLVMLLGLEEYRRMTLATQGRARLRGVGLGAAALFTLAAYGGDFVLLLAGVVFVFLILFMLDLLRLRSGVRDLPPVALALMGIVYVPLLLAHFILLRREPEGSLWIFLVLVVAFSGDTMGFYVGRTWGRRKLLPAVSPGKSVEGTLGVVAGSAVGSLVFAGLCFPLLSLFHAACIGCLGGILGQIGDLCESAIKRASSVKDSGALLPGHGGILDRLDSLAFLAPFVFYYQRLLVP